MPEAERSRTGGDAEEGPSRRRVALQVGVVALCVALLAWTVARLGPGRAIEAARRADPVWLVLSLLPIPLRFLIWAFKWRRMLRREGPIGLAPALRAVHAGAFVNLTTPTAKLAGGLVRALLVHRTVGWPRRTVYGWALADQFTNVLGNLALAGALAVAAGLALRADGGGRVFLLSGSVALLLVGLAAALRAWLSTPQRTVGLAGALERLVPRRFRNHPVGRPASDAGAAVEESVGETVAPVLRPLLGRAGAGRFEFASDVALSMLAFAALCLANALTLRALGEDTAVVVIACCAALGYFAGTLVGTMGGIGATEAAMIALYARAGVEPGAAAAGALLHRAGFYGFTLLAGGLALWRSREGRRARAAGRRT